MHIAHPCGWLSADHHRRKTDNDRTAVSGVITHSSSWRHRLTAFLIDLHEGALDLNHCATFDGGFGIRLDIDLC